jgi:hypothetical protein
MIAQNAVGLEDCTPRQRAGSNQRTHNNVITKAQLPNASTPEGLRKAQLAPDEQGLSRIMGPAQLAQTMRDSLE